ncbi:MAG: TRAP transporter small permease [Pseudomonadota bacterium]
MRLLDRIARLLSGAGAALAALLIVYILGHILLEIALRVVFSRSTYVLDEFVGYAVAALTFLGLGHAFRSGDLIRVDLITARLDREQRRALELASVAATLLATLFCAFWVGRDALRNLLRGAVSESVAEVPLWLPLGMVLLGMLVFALQLAAHMAQVALGGPLLGETETEAEAAKRQGSKRQGAERDGAEREVGQPEPDDPWAVDDAETRAVARGEDRTPAPRPGRAPAANAEI